MNGMLSSGGREYLGAKMFFLITMYLAGAIFCASLVSATAADQAPQDPGRPPSSQAPALPPPVPPSKIDPGIQKQPDTLGSPEAVVPPPVVDPNMVIDPEKPRAGNATPPSKKPEKPDGPITPQ